MARPARKNRRGVATVEAALTLPVVLILMVGTWEVGRLIEAQEIMCNAAREGGRQASTGVMTASSVQTVVLNYLNNAGLSTAHAQVTVGNLTHPNVDPTLATQGDQLQIVVSLPFSDIRWSSAQLVTSSSTQLSAQCVWLSARGLQYPTNVSVPQGY